MHTIIRNRKELSAAIDALEQRRASQEKLLIDELHTTYESLKPANVLRQVTSSPMVRNSVVKAAVGLGAGMLTENLLMGGAAGTVKKIIGNVLKFGIATFVTARAARQKSKKAGQVNPV